MTKLSDLGFSKDAISETIVTTYSAEGKPNAAPMGATIQNPSHLFIKFYNTSQTFKNVQATKCAVVNVTSNIDLFYRTAFKEANPNGKLPTEWFNKAQTVNAPKLQTAEATIETTVSALKPIDTERTQTTLEVKQITAAESLPKAPNRAFAATLEAIIHTTRIKAFLKGDEKQKNHVKKLLETLETCSETVHRTAPNSHYAEIITDLSKMIAKWRKPQ